MDPIHSVWRDRRAARAAVGALLACLVALPASAQAPPSASVKIPTIDWDCRVGPPTPFHVQPPDKREQLSAFSAWVEWWDKCREQLVGFPRADPRPDPIEPNPMCRPRTYFEDGACYQVSCTLCPATPPEGVASPVVVDCLQIQRCWWEPADEPATGGPRIVGIYSTRFGDVVVTREGAETHHRTVDRATAPLQGLLRAMVDEVELPSPDPAKVPPHFFGARSPATSVKEGE